MGDLRSRGLRWGLGMLLAGGMAVVPGACADHDVTALGPDIEVEPEEVNFGTVTLGLNLSEDLLVMNVGGGTLTVTSVTMQDGSGPFSVEDFAGEVAPNAATTVAVHFTAVDPSPAEDVVLIASDDPNEPIVEVPVYVLDVIGDDDDVGDDDGGDDDVGDDDGGDDDVGDDDGGDDDGGDDDVGDDDGGDDDGGDDDVGDDDVGDDDTGGPSSGDAHPDWVAAGPLTYTHDTGGGAFNDRTIGVDDDVVQSLEGTDFACGDIVTFFEAIAIDSNPGANNLTFETEVLFECAPSGQPGVAFGDVVLVTMNYGSVQNGGCNNSTDCGMIDDGGSTVTIVDEYYVPMGTTPFNGADEVFLRFRVDDLEPSEQVIVRIDAWLVCEPGASPSGTIHAEVDHARLVEADGVPISPPVEIPIGTMAIPLGQLGQLGEP